MRRFRGRGIIITFSSSSPRSKRRGNRCNQGPSRPTRSSSPPILPSIVQSWYEVSDVRQLAMFYSKIKSSTSRCVFSQEFRILFYGVIRLSSSCMVLVNRYNTHFLPLRRIICKILGSQDLKRGTCSSGRRGRVFCANSFLCQMNG